MEYKNKKRKTRKSASRRYLNTEMLVKFIKIYLTCTLVESKYFTKYDEDE